MSAIGIPAKFLTITDVGEALAHDPTWKDSILEPIRFLRVDSLGESAVTVKALGKVMPGTHWDVAGEFRERLQTAFAKHGIEMTIAQRLVQTKK